MQSIMVQLLTNRSISMMTAEKQRKLDRKIFVDPRRHMLILLVLVVFYFTYNLIAVQGWTTSMVQYSLSKSMPLSVLHFYQNKDYTRLRYSYPNKNTELSVLTRVDDIIAQQQQQGKQYTSDSTTTADSTSRETRDTVEEKQEVDENNDDIDNEGYEQPKSMFGTKEYWDTTYMGHGDFPSDEYTWYYGWDDISKILNQYNINVFSKPKEQEQQQQQQSSSNNNRNNKILIPGIGNDRILLDMIQQLLKTTVKNPTIAKSEMSKTIIVAQDYSEHAIDRQSDMLDFNGNTFTVIDDNNFHNVNNENHNQKNNNILSKEYEIQLIVNNVRKLPKSWYGSFDYIIEKGLLDAVYLSSDDNEAIMDAVTNLEQCLKPNGILISISGVVPNELRNTILFPVARATTTVTKSNNDTRAESATTTTWTWLRDGTNDLRAGCFILQKS